MLTKILIALIIALAIFGGSYLFFLHEKSGNENLVVENLSLSRSEVKPGQVLTITVDVKNFGDSIVSKKLKFNVGEEILTKNVTLKPMEEKEVNLSVSKETGGVYQVSVSGMIQEYRVMSEVDSSEKLGKIRIFNVFNNYGHDPELSTSWGFSCFIKTETKNVLFDTGGNGEILLGNLEKMGLDPKDVDLVFLSHIHGDHVGGLLNFLKVNSEVTIYLPQSFPETFEQKIEDFGAEWESIGPPMRMSSGMWSTGELEGPPQEQSLILSTKKGLVIITGCAHPGIVNIVKKSKELLDEKIYLVMGGFHLGGASDQELRSIVKSFRKMGVEKVSPTHCSGDRCREIFQEDYRENFLPDGVGSTFYISTEEP